MTNEEGYITAAKVCLALAVSIGGFSIMAHYGMKFWPRMAVYCLFGVAFYIYFKEF